MQESRTNHQIFIVRDSNSEHEMSGTQQLQFTKDSSTATKILAQLTLLYTSLVQQRNYRAGP